MRTKEILEDLKKDLEKNILAMEKVLFKNNYKLMENILRTKEDFMAFALGEAKALKPRDSLDRHIRQGALQDLIRWKLKYKLSEVKTGKDLDNISYDLRQGILGFEITKDMRKAMDYYAEGFTLLNQDISKRIALLSKD